MMPMNRFFQILRRLVWPPICRGCGSRLNIFDSADSFLLCPDCMKQWRAALDTRCVACQKTLGQCQCLPKALSSVGCDDWVRVVPYHPGKRGVVERMIFVCKERRDRELFRFLGEALGSAIRERADDGQAVVTWVPRRPVAVRQYGHDQAKELAIEVAKALAVPAMETIQRRRGSGQAAQKTFSADERILEAARSYERLVPCPIAEKTVILIDDVCTTGASLAACCALLREGGADRVICATVAGTVEEN